MIPKVLAPQRQAGDRKDLFAITSSRLPQSPSHRKRQLPPPADRAS